MFCMKSLNFRLLMKSILSDKISVHSGSINRLGMFAKSNINCREIVYIKGGHVMSRAELFSSSIINSYLPISDEWVIGALSAKEEEAIKLYNNHSCNPNCAVRGDVVFIASRNITEGEELFIDYAFVDNEPYRFKCNCGATNCRKIITGFDWQLRKLQKGYKKNFFSAYIRTKIDSGINYECYTKLDEQIIRLRNEVFVKELQFQEEGEFDGDESHYLHCCLFKKNDLVAYARVKIEAAQARIGRVVVKQGERKKGYGKQIMFWAETEALKHGINNVYVHSLCEAGPFYEKLGYIVDGEQFVEDGRKHILMKKTLILD